MPAYSLIGLCTLSFLSACAVPQQPSRTANNADAAYASMQDTIRGNIKDKTEEVIQTYAATYTCRNVELDNAVKVINYNIDSSYDASRRAVSKDFFQSIVEDSGRSLIKLGDVAAKKKCTDVAREQYIEIIDKFVGNAYSSLRQRAEVGIDDLRALQSGKAAPRSSRR